MPDFGMLVLLEMAREERTDFKMQKVLRREKTLQLVQHPHATLDII